MAAVRRPVSPIPEYPRLRTRRACQICRRRKVKCDGVTPSCGQCSLRGALCYYKDDDGAYLPPAAAGGSATSGGARMSLGSAESVGSGGSEQSSPTTTALQMENAYKRRKVDSPVPPSSTASKMPFSPLSGPMAGGLAVQQHMSPIHSTLYSGVTASNPGIDESFIYYGPASTFSFIQHIHQEINAGTIEMNGVGDVPEGIKKYGFRDLFLGWTADKSQETSAMAGSVKFLDPPTAAKFADNFWRTLGYIIPVYTRAYIDSLLEAMYNSKITTVRGEAGLLCVLATGASLEGETEWSNLFFERALEIVQSTSEVISTDRVKVLLMLSHLQAMGGKMNMAYNLSGQGVRLAYACGLHRDFPLLSQYSHDGLRNTQDRRLTVWSLYSFERLLSISLGRPSAFNDGELDVSLPDNDFLRYMAPLGRISMKSSQLIYGLHNSSVLSIWEHAREIDEELVQYQSELPANLRFEDFGKPGIVLHADAFVIGCHYYMFKTLTYRPFLLIDGLLRKQERMHASQGLTSPPTIEDRGFLPEACRRAVEAGRGLLLLLARSYSSNPMLATMRFNSMFLQNACAILLFDVLRDPWSKHEVMTNFEIINIALECYRLMKADVGVESGLAMIEQVQARAREAFEMANRERAHSAAEEMDGAAQVPMSSARTTTGVSAQAPVLVVTPKPESAVNVMDLFTIGVSPDVLETGPGIGAMSGESGMGISPSHLHRPSNNSSPIGDISLSATRLDGNGTATTARAGSHIDITTPSSSTPVSATVAPNIISSTPSAAPSAAAVTDKANDDMALSSDINLNSIQFWEHWDEGFDWLKSGFMLPADNKS
ncbi:uncharacterized protein V1518DRAFT_408184 [Limtongia smithiae]|uniref:uncharacterized protein n=1 Tax=Limtongia smithiae TaxID=1125753 RepID=UPI0034CDC8DE